MAYGKFRHGTILGEKGTTWNVEIWKDGATSSTEIDFAGEGFEITWNGQGGTRDRQFLGSECKLNCFIKDATDESFLYDTISSGFKKYFIRIYKGAVQNDNLWWYGWLNAAFDNIQNAPFPYVAQLTANDSYGYFSKQAEKSFANEAEKNTSHEITDIFRSIFSDMDINDVTPSGTYPIRTNMDWWQPSDTYNSESPTKLYRVAKGFVTKPTVYDEDGTIDVNNNPFEYKESDVFDGVIKACSMVGFLSDGMYNFIQPNSLIDNPTGVITTYQYHENSLVGENPSNPIDLTTLLTINQSSNVILAGSNITFEPSYKSVFINYIAGFANFNVSQGQNLTTEFYAGSIQSGVGSFHLDFYAKHDEEIDLANFTFNADSGGQSWQTLDSSFLSTGLLKIKITDGTTTKYLIEDPGQGFAWTAVNTTITLYRGFAADSSTPVNNPAGMCVGPISDTIPNNYDGWSTGPCQRYYNSAGGANTKASFSTDFKFAGPVPDPEISGDIFIEFDASNNYYQAVRSANGSIWDWSYDTLNDPTPTQISTIAINITLEPIDQINDFDNDVTNGIIFGSNQTLIDSKEAYDLGDIGLGKSQQNQMYSFQYNAGTSGSPNYQIISGFQRGNPTPDNPLNPTQLMLNEFLELQVRPLEILQADIQSANISPLKLIKYSINDDSSFKYYSFLGGTFKAQSEIMSGEWYKVDSATVIGTTSFPDPIITNDYSPTHNHIYNQGPKPILNTVVDITKDDSLGTTNAIITYGSTNVKVNLNANSKGKIYDNQKLVLRYPDGSNSLILTADGGNTTSDSGIDVDSFVPRISYPKNSILSPLIYDFTNVIQGAPNLFKGVTTTAIYIRPDEFIIPSTSSISMYTRDDVSSVQPSSYVNRSTVYATSFVPLNYKVTAVDIYSDTARGFSVYEGIYNASGTTTLDSGTSNTTLTLSSAWTSVEGKYIILEFGFGATDKIYGAKLTIEAV